MIASSPKRRRSSSRTRSAGVDGLRQLEEAELRGGLAEVRRVEPHQADTPPAVHFLEQLAHDAEQLVARVGPALQRARVRGGAEVLVAVLERDGARLEVVSAQARRDAVGELQQRGAQALGIGGVLVVGVLLAQALVAGGLPRHVAVVLATREPLQVVAVRADLACEPRRVERGQLADRGDPELGERLLHLGSHAPEPPHRQRRQEGGFRAGSDHRQAVGLAHVGGDLGDELGARDADRGRELRLVADRLLERCGRSSRPSRAPARCRSRRGTPRRSRPARRGR